MFATKCLQISSDLAWIYTDSLKLNVFSNHQRILSGCLKTYLNFFNKKAIKYHLPPFFSSWCQYVFPNKRPLPTKVHLVKAMVFPVVMYGWRIGL